MPASTFTTRVQRLLKQTERMRQQAVKNLLRTLKHIDQERKQRTADLEEAAEVIFKQLAELGHGGVNSKTATTKAKNTTIAKVTTPSMKHPIRRRRKFAQTGVEFVLSTVKTNKSMTTAEINAAWKKNGRGGTADNSLTDLIKTKKLKRMPVKDGLGSIYSAA